MSDDKSRIAPTVGRIVHYVAYGTPGGEFPAGVCRAAIITQVLPDLGAIGLVALNPTGLFFHEKCYESIEPKGGTWHWPERE